MGRPNAALMITQSERSQLRSIVRSRSLPHSLVRRAQIVLLSAAGAANREVARRCGVSAPVVSLWRQRYQQRGIAGLHAELRPGRPRSHSDEQVAGLLRKVRHSKPAVATHWSVRSVAAHTGISKSTVARYFALFGLQPHRSKSFKLSTDPFFVEKVRDIVGLYLNPPDNALVLWWTRRARCRPWSAPSPCCRWGSVMSGGDSRYYRHGTTTLFAALDIVDGGVISQCKPRHHRQRS